MLLAFIFVVEGEKDVDNLRALGIPATCNAGGAGKWREAAAVLRNTIRYASYQEISCWSQQEMFGGIAADAPSATQKDVILVVSYTMG